MTSQWNRITKDDFYGIITNFLKLLHFHESESNKDSDSWQKDWKYIKDKCDIFSFNYILIELAFEQKYPNENFVELYNMWLKDEQLFISEFLKMANNISLINKHIILKYNLIRLSIPAKIIVEELQHNNKKDFSKYTSLKDIELATSFLKKMPLYMLPKDDDIFGTDFRFKLGKLQFNLRKYISTLIIKNAHIISDLPLEDDKIHQKFKIVTYYGEKEKTYYTYNYIMKQYPYLFYTSKSPMSSESSQEYVCNNSIHIEIDTDLSDIFIKFLHSKDINVDDIISLEYLSDVTDELCDKYSRLRSISQEYHITELTHICDKIINIIGCLKDGTSRDNYTDEMIDYDTDQSD